MNTKSQAKILTISLGILILMGIFIVFFASALPTAKQPFITYTPSSDTICKDGICNKVLYSGIRNVYEDETWKRVENARSLKDKGFNVIYLENDPDFEIDVIDFNMTSISMYLNFTGNWQFYPEYCSKNINNEIKCKFKLEEKYKVWNTTKEDYDEIEIEYEQEFELEENKTKEKVELKIVGNPLGKEFKFGGNSTTIKLQEADTENLEDVELDVSSEPTPASLMIKFNISSIPSGQTIEEAWLNLYLLTDFNGNESVTVYRIPNQDWTETDSNSSLNTTWAGRTNAINRTWNPFLYSSFNKLNVTENIQSDYDLENSKSTLGLEDPLYLVTSVGVIYGSETAMYLGKASLPAYYSRALVFATKENTDVTKRPYLNITYDYLLDIFIDHPKSQSYGTNESLSLNYTIINTTILDTCWYYILNSTSDYEVSNTTIADCQNITFNVSQSDTYTLYIHVNETGGLEESDSVVFYVSLENPAVVLDTPINNHYFDNGSNIYFNFTTVDTDGLDTCELWSNWTGTWHKNYTWVGPTSGIQNYTVLNLTDSKSVWNVWCNDSLGNEGYAPNNFTATIDTINPTLTIDSISTPSGSQTITFTNNISDTNLDSCKYSIFDSDGNIDGLNENVSFTCNAETSATATAFATYNLTVYAIDYAKNEKSITKSFTTSAAVTPPGNGGGTPAAPTPKNKTWYMKNDKGTDSYELLMDSNDERRKQIVFTNIGEENVTLELSCVDISGLEKICKYVEIEKSEISLPPSVTFETVVYFIITLPKEIEDGEYDFNIISKDISEIENTDKLSVKLFIGKVGIIPTIVSQFKGYRYLDLSFLSEKAKAIPIPKLLIDFLILIISFMFFNLLIYKKLKHRFAVSFFSSLMVTSVVFWFI